MEQSPELDKMAETIKAGIDNNAKDSPQVSIDPETSKMSVIGDPNNVQPTSGDYALTFLYPADQVPEVDKPRMIYREETDEYAATVKYQSRRVKPLYRTKVTILIAKILDDMGVIDDSGYNSALVSETAGLTLVNHSEDLADLARMILNVPREQMDYMDAESLAGFFNQLLDNEPNIVKEAVVFLMQSRLRQTTNAEPTQTQSKSQNTPHS